MKKQAKNFESNKPEQLINRVDADSRHNNVV